MKKFIQALIVLLTLSFAAVPAMAKDETKSSKAKSSTVKKAKKSTKKSTKKSEDKASKKSKKDKKSKDSKAKDSKKDGKTKTSKSASSKSDEKTSRSSSSDTSAKKGSDKSSKSSAKSGKKKVKSALTGTDKAKQFKNVTVNINKADADTLAYYLVGIGAERAKAIVKYRKKNGKFKSTGDLMQVPGIGEAIFAGLKKNVSTSRGETSVPKKSSTSSSSSKK